MLKNPNYTTLLDRAAAGSMPHTVAFHALGGAEKFAGRAQELATDRTLSEFGRVARLRDEMPGLLRILREASRPLRRALSDLARRREELGKVDVKTTAFPADDLREIRSIIRGLPEAERIKFVMENLGDPAIAAAVLAVTSRHQVGLTGEHLSTVQRHYVETQNGTALKALEAEEEQLSVAAAAYAIAKADLQSVAQLGDHEMSAIVGPIEQADP